MVYPKNKFEVDDEFRLLKAALVDAALFGLALMVLLVFDGSVAASPGLALTIRHLYHLAPAVCAFIVVVWEKLYIGLVFLVMGMVCLFMDVGVLWARVENLGSTPGISDMFLVLIDVFFLFTALTYIATFPLVAMSNSELEPFNQTTDSDKQPTRVPFRAGYLTGVFIDVIILAVILVITLLVFEKDTVNDYIYLCHIPHIVCLLGGFLVYLYEDGEWGVALAIPAIASIALDTAAVVWRSFEVIINPLPIRIYVCFLEVIMVVSSLLYVAWTFRLVMATMQSKLKSL